MQFGIATADISPTFPMTMAGYGARLDRFDDVHDPLSFTALILEERGKRLCIGAADLICFENTHVMRLREKIAKVIDAPVDHVLLNASHTHGGPEFRDGGAYYGAHRSKSVCAQYRKWLEGPVLQATRKALAGLAPGSLWIGEGASCIPMNRRLDRDGTVVNAPNPDGPVDDRVQVLALRDRDDVLRAVGVRLSCHPVSTGAQHRITADYPGAFRAAARRALGDEVVPFFLQGAGGDMRPSQVDAGDRWRALAHDELPVIGDTLMREALAVLTGGHMTKLGPLSIRGRLQDAIVPCEVWHTEREEFERMLESGSGSDLIYATEALHQLDTQGKLASETPLRVHALWLTRDFVVVGIQAEVLIGMGAYVERSLKPARTLLLGYSNGCECYLPDTKELKRGGYEQSSYIYHGWTGPLKSGVEKVIAAAVWRR